MDALPTYPAIQTYSFFRELTWRWDRARQLVDTRSRLSRRTDDDSTIAAAKFIRAFSTQSCSRLRKLWPALYVAKDLAISGPTELWEIRARILAGQSDDAIARHCNIPSDVIREYESFFFNVRDRLRARDWIFFRTIRIGSQGFMDCDPFNLWAAFGYNGGPCVLDVVIKVCRNADAPDWPLASDATDGPAEQSARRLIAALMIPPDASERQLRDLHLAHRSHELARKKPRETPDLDDAVSSFFDRLSAIVAAPNTQENSIAVA